MCLPYAPIAIKRLPWHLVTAAAAERTATATVAVIATEARQRNNYKMDAASAHGRSKHVHNKLQKGSKLPTRSHSISIQILSKFAPDNCQALGFPHKNKIHRCVMDFPMLQHTHEWGTLICHQYGHFGFGQP